MKERDDVDLNSVLGDNKETSIRIENLILTMNSAHKSVDFETRYCTILCTEVVHLDELDDTSVLFFTVMTP